MGTKGSSTAVMEHDGTGEAVARKRGPRPRASDQRLGLQPEVDARPA